ncbi:MAG: GtrA family protein [Cytophagales bacterium]|nr:GtrA family protein [Cytophagales bacterium]
MELLFKLLKFGLVGLSGMAIDFGATYLLKEHAKLHKYIANGVGFSLAATNNFYWNKVWTFEDTNVEVTQQYLSFVIVSLIGLGINTLVLIVLEKRMEVNFYFAKIVAIMVVVLWNFTMNYLFTF